jgi:hypothetical protein
MEDYLSGGFDRLVVKPTRALIIDYDTFDILQGVSSPSWVRQTKFREGGPFQPLYPVCVHIGLLFILLLSLTTS